MIQPDDLNRTIKLELDEGRAETLEEAIALASSYVLQLHIGRGLGASRTRQAMVLTAVNAAARAFPGGVRVLVTEDDVLNIPRARGSTTSSAIESLGGELVADLDSGLPTICIGDFSSIELPELPIFPTWNGWACGVVFEQSQGLAEAQEFELSGVFAGALAVSEAFRERRGDLTALSIESGISLWSSDFDWRDDRSRGPVCSFLPSQWWLLGLGHLGQAMAWSLGLLPFSDRDDVTVYLQDFDLVSNANVSTGLLLNHGHVGRTKARVVSDDLEALGIGTRIVERAFDVHTVRSGSEPSLALAGFDDPNPRRHLGGANFDYVIDVGLGGGPNHFDEIQLHTFPSALDPTEAFASRPSAAVDIDHSGYRQMIEDLVEGGASLGDATCGVIEVASRTVGAAFVGAAASALALAEATKIVCQGIRSEVVDLSLRELAHAEIVPTEEAGPRNNPGYVTVDREG